MPKQTNNKQYYGKRFEPWDPPRATRINKNYSNIDNFKHAILLPLNTTQYGTTYTNDSARK